ncbi:MAG: hypothetical protein COT84_08840 [Chlamydiae bacterium CG10_big_fil_rev_8_21_14_0_10_35_9]|nr:MAG: hypothetical protein COT84_08840 [Chlamydiae bacterium CG10_big_fil_rev_8_21_14_0_10_35_9]
MESIGEEIKKRQNSNSSIVNSNKKYITTVNSNSDLSLEEEITSVFERHGVKPEGVAKMLAEGLDDTKSERYYLLLAKENNMPKLLEALHITKQAKQESKLRISMAVYFLGILKNWGFKTKFKK